VFKLLTVWYNKQNTCHQCYLKRTVIVEKLSKCIEIKRLKKCKVSSIYMYNKKIFDFSPEQLVKKDEDSCQAGYQIKFWRDKIVRVKDKVFFPKVSEEWIITLGITEENGGSLEALEDVSRRQVGCQRRQRDDVTKKRTDELRTWRTHFTPFLLSSGVTERN